MPPLTPLAAEQPYRRSDVWAAIAHTVIVIIVVMAATYLRATNRLDNASIGVVYGGALGFASGSVVQTRRR